jgi:hypothetical protein
MGHWGEAMALNEPFWQRQDTEAGRKALARITDSAALTPKEREWIAAARVLYGDGDKRARDGAYALALERMAQKHPDDLEVRAFHALALIGTLRQDEPGLATRMRAGAIALDVLAKNPEHPGAAHYVIHAFDDADHAVLALPAARRYAVIAPAAFHARHMPAHIFVNLGMWDEAASACESAWAASDAWAQRRKVGIDRRDYHSLDWLVAIYHQQGRMKKAEEALATFAAAARESTVSDVDVSYIWAVGSFVARTRQLDRLEALLASVAATGKLGGDGAPACHATAPGNAGGGDPQANVNLALARQRAMIAAERGDAREVERQVKIAGEQVKRLSTSTYGPQLVKNAERSKKLYAARLAAAQRRWDEAEARLREIIAGVADSPFRSAADPWGRAYETLLGDVLLAAKKPREAAAAYAAALRVTPADSLALLGAARAARALGDEATAAAHYRKLRVQWEHADADFPDLAEARAGAELGMR